MPSKGFNSILFDVSSIIDDKLTYIKFLKEEYSKEELENYFDADIIFSTSIRDFEKYHVNGDEDLFRHIVKDEFLKTNSDKLFYPLYNRDKTMIFKNPKSTLCMTDISVLINSYISMAANLIKVSIRCNDNLESDIMNKIWPTASVFVSSRENVDMSNYTRLVVGSYLDALQYQINEPKSILVLDYTENFVDKEKKIFPPEFVTEFGDINDLAAISAYRI